MMHRWVLFLPYLPCQRKSTDPFTLTEERYRHDNDDVLTFFMDSISLISSAGLLRSVDSAEI